MPAPSTAITRFDLSMAYAEIALAASRQGFIGLKALPPIGVAKEEGDFLKILVEDLMRATEDTERPPRGAYKRDDFNWTKDSFSVKEHGVEEVVDDALIERYGDIIRAETICSQRAVHRVLAALEQAIADAVFNTTTWTGSALTTAITTDWTNAASATPLADLDGAIEKVKASSGMMPNTIILTDLALRYFKRTAEVEDLLKYSGRDDPKNLGDSLRELFEIENILVARSFNNSAKEGQSASFSRYWNSDRVMVCHVHNDGMDGDLEAPMPNIGRTIFPTGTGIPLPGMDEDGESGLIVEEYREEARRGGVMRARTKYQVKVIHAEAGHLLTGATS